MTQRYYFDSALLAQGWAQGVLVDVGSDGRISAVGLVAAGAAPPADSERVTGMAIPGMPNAHSHAFQRAMAGKAEYRLSSRDSFWTWRQAMYGLANRIEPDELQVLATQLFIEMLKSGYTTVAEFHYLHRRSNGALYPEGRGFWDAVGAAADAAGIALTLLPTLYQNSDLGEVPLRRDQARFALETEWFVRAVEQRLAAERRDAYATVRTGAAFHSLRAVALSTVHTVTGVLRSLDPTLPLHIHVAEQADEVSACKLATGRRPVELLLDTGLLDRHWCLVHATHASPQELRGIAATLATVCVSISTEANLGDGLFDSARFLKLGGRMCVGSDSQSTVCPAEELRWMEYEQRLRKRRRAVLADAREIHIGTRLWRDCAQHGAQAIGQPVGAIAVGRRADWLVLDPTHPSMAGTTTDAALDHVVFAGGHAAIRDVMVGGRWVIKDHHHAAEQPLRPRFVEVMRRLWAA